MVEQLGITGMSKSAVPRMCAALDEQVVARRERPLEGRHPYLRLDAKVERVRDPDGGCAARRWWSGVESPLLRRFLLGRAGALTGHSLAVSPPSRCTSFAMSPV